MKRWLLSYDHFNVHGENVCISNGSTDHYWSYSVNDTLFQLICQCHSHWLSFYYNSNIWFFLKLTFQLPWHQWKTCNLNVFQFCYHFILLLVKMKSYFWRWKCVFVYFTTNLKIIWKFLISCKRWNCRF